MQRRTTSVERIQITKPAAHALVFGFFDKLPVELIIVHPFAPLRQFYTHEQQLFSLLAIHVAQ